MYKDSIGYKYLQEMMKTESFKELATYYERPSKELLESFLKENIKVYSFFLFMNIFVYGYDNRDKYQDLMSNYNLEDVAVFLGCSKQFYNPIHIVLTHLIKYELVNEEDKEILEKIIHRKLDEEM